MFILTISLIIALTRIFKASSSVSDRVMLIDSISFIIIGIIGIFSMLTDTVAYLESILLIGILAFLSTIALCRFIERGVVIERKRDR
jgi:multicomponent Na+:H+ antiporter subunit F